MAEQEQDSYMRKAEEIYDFMQNAKELVKPLADSKGISVFEEPAYKKLVCRYIANYLEADNLRAESKVAMDMLNAGGEGLSKIANSGRKSSG